MGKGALLRGETILKCTCHKYPSYFIFGSRVSLYATEKD